MIVSARSYLTAGLAAALVTGTTGAVMAAPPSGAALTAIASPAVHLAAAAAPLLQSLGTAATGATTGAFVGADVGGLTESPGDWIINAYNVVQPWVAYGVELFAWATEWLPWPIGLLAPQADIIYSGWQPFAESVVYSFAFLIDGQFDLVLPTLSAGIQTGVNNLIQGEIAWILSFFPPLPPIGGAFPAAAAATTARGPGVSTPPEPAAVSTANGEAPAATETAAAETAPAEAAPAIEAEQANPTAVTPVAVTANAESDTAEPDIAEPDIAEPAEATVAARTARMPRSVPAAAGTIDITATSPAVVPAAPTGATARKATRGPDSDAGSGRAARTARGAR